MMVTCNSVSVIELCKLFYTLTDGAVSLKTTVKDTTAMEHSRLHLY